ncbi:alpha/beta fold hydrolase [Vulcanisaeta souniana]|uniref:3-oxoadipate enol-lactonase n=2 Tax=Vulcanisaeta souniana JCM 11219 TaxID=1293586 RepID=A0ABM8BL66_9CREN|nr:alpha/beta fold hydrolase [Vulcanisaeta souniana]BDR91710.1 3-oxoadipate enol-lactonase [Vulcanisaeta souniana JCM 11219]
MARNMKSGYVVTRDGTSIYYEIDGEGEPLVLIEGLGYASWMWIKQRPLANNVKLIIYDNRGVGLSSKPDRPYTMDDFINDLEDLLNYLSINRAFLWGVSMGGMIAMYFAYRNPGKVKGLILGETNFGIKSLPPSKEALEVLMQPPRPGIDRKQALIDRMRVAFSRNYFGAHKDEIERIAEIRMKFEEDPKAYNNQLAAVLTFDFRDKLPSITIPTLIVTGDEDYVVNPQNSYIMNQLIPNSRLVILRGAGHLAIIERDDDYNRLVLNFISEVINDAFKPSKEPMVI